MRHPARILHSLALAGIALYARGTGAQVAQPVQIPQSPAPRSPVIVGQPTESCVAGRVFGITEFVCTSCRMSSPRDSTHVVYSFSSEPYVVETDNNPNGRIKPGDKIVAINGSPITTRAGADQFAYPPLGLATLTVSRNNQNISIEQPVQTQRYCPVLFRAMSVSPDSLQRLSAGAMAAAARGSVGAAQGGGGGGAGGGGRGGRGGARAGGGAGGVMLRTDSMGNVIAMDTALAARMQRTADSLRLRAIAAPTGRGISILRAAPPEPTSFSIPFNFGVTLTCTVVCTKTRSRDGTTQYWRFDAFPVVTSISPASIAEKAGLRDGDVLLLVNGVSPQVEEGALILQRAAREQTLRLEVRRDGKVEKITLKL